ncbi:hypothetical protein CHS0354_034855 [Potamilus streckersoni]|uniref:EF-hand domain-containing protein n=1 Tax=Potamilus streckersoni TaxID=2493646 RepID=A0AAE0TKU6_9BIVA|nr:hypothetical protein CHS0354_034855 [Potamilus streckersoni]
MDIDFVRIQRVFRDIARMGGDETKISQNEFITAMRLLGLNPTESDTRDLLARHDKDGSGDLDLEEFRTLVLELYESKTAMEEDLEQAFDHYDTDGSGKLDALEIKKILCDLGDEPLSYEEADEFLTQLDTDADGKISLQELKALLHSEDFYEPQDEVAP